MRPFNPVLALILVTLSATCGATSESRRDGGPPDASPDAEGEADGAQASDSADDVAASCSFGEATSEASTSNLSLFGTPVFFNGGASVPAGEYLVNYVDGCVKYGGGQGWTVNAYDGGCCSWWVIGETTADKKVVPPGTIGYAVGSGAYAKFEDCVEASKKAPPKSITHTGGKLGIWLQDSPYSDNLSGEGGRNPKWRLSSVGPCSGH
jgi:hypothetical protein